MSGKIPQAAHEIPHKKNVRNDDKNIRPMDGGTLKRPADIESAFLTHSPTRLNGFRVSACGFNRRPYPQAFNTRNARSVTQGLGWRFAPKSAHVLPV